MTLSDRRALPGAIAMAAIVGLAALGLGADAPWAAGAALAATGLSEVLRRTARRRLGGAWILPAVGGAALVLAPAPLSLPSAALALSAGLALLAWAGLDEGASALWEGLLLPGLTGALAVLATAVLPLGPAREGLAAGVLALLLLAVAISLSTGRHPGGRTVAS